MQQEAYKRGVGVLDVQRERLAEAEAARYADAARVNALVAQYGSYERVMAALAAAERAAAATAAQAAPEGPPSIGRSVSPPR
jgi:hypothetical protein